MKTWKYRFAIGAAAALAIGCNRLPAQELVPPAKLILVVPALQYEPERPRPLAAPAGFTQAPPTGITQASQHEPAELTPALPPEITQPPKDGIYRYWARADYLNWWISRPPISVPLVTSATPPAIGALTEPGTKVLFGAGAADRPTFGAFNGMRMTIGGWLENNYDYGWEFSGLVLDRRSAFFSASSPGGAAPGVAIPFNATDPFNMNAAGETSLNSGGAPASATVRLASQLWGLELNELAYVWANKNFYFTIVLGARYLNMNESLTLNYTTFDPATGGNVVTTDGFGTHNQFFAGQAGWRTGGTLGKFTFDTTAMLMCGPMREVLNIAGGTTVTGGAFGFTNGTTNAGVFAEPTNIGMHSRGVIAVGTDLQFKVGYAITPRIQPYIGYNALYLNNVIRPGNQIDRNVNVTQNAFFVPPGTLTGNVAPTATIRGSDFWAHGLQLGIELRY